MNNFNLSELGLRKSFYLYLEKSKQIENSLKEKPNDWGKFQSEFNANINQVFFKINATLKDRNDSLFESKFKKFFIKRIRSIFLKGDLNKWSLNKPYGYAGDFRIIEEIYKNQPVTKGFELLFDNYFLMSAISIAVRNRKNDFKKNLIEFISNNKSKKIIIMNLACGPAREIKEIINEGWFRNVDIEVHCYDHDDRALEYAEKLIANKTVKFFNLNALKLALSKNPSLLVKHKYDFIYSTGLFDYLNQKLSIGLVRNLRSLLKKDGILSVSDVRDKYSNPSVSYMELVGEWSLSYNNDDEFRRVFVEAGFKKNNLLYNYEQQGIMQYVLAKNE